MMNASRVLAVVSVLALAVAAGCLEDAPEDDPQPTSTGTTTPSSTTSPSPTPAATTTTATPSPTSTGPQANRPPEGTLTASAVQGTTPFNTTIRLTGSDPDKDPLAWTMDVHNDGSMEVTGDARRGDRLPATHTFTVTQGGNITIKATLGDRQGHLVTLWLNITATDPGQAGGEGGPTVVSEDDNAVIYSDGTCHAKGAVMIPGAEVWVHDRGAAGGTWIYGESNGVEGLQLGGSAEDAAYVDCVDPDLLIF